MLFTIVKLHRCQAAGFLKMLTLVYVLLLTSASPMVDNPQHISSEFAAGFENGGEGLDNNDYGENGVEGRLDITTLLERPYFSTRQEQFIADERVGRTQLDMAEIRDSLEYQSEGVFQDTFGKYQLQETEMLEGEYIVSGPVAIDSGQQDYEEAISDNVNNNIPGTADRRIRSALPNGDDNSLEDNSQTTNNIGAEYVSINDNLGDIPRFDPWAFETKMDVDLDISVRRLYLFKSEMEDYIAVVKRKDRLYNITFNVMDVNVTNTMDVHSGVYSRQINNAEETYAYADDPGYYPEAPVLNCHFLSAYKKQWVKLVSTCPPQWADGTARRQCVGHVSNAPGNIIDVLSIPVQDDLGVVYKNVYCAECNNAYDTEAWDVSMQCDGASAVYFINGKLALSFMPGFRNSSHCRQTLLPAQPIKVQRCHVTKRRSRLRDKPYPESQAFESVSYPVSFSLLMNFGFDGKTHILFSSTSQVVGTYNGNTCSKAKQIWDSNTRQCRTVRCTEGYDLIDNVCVGGATYSNQLITSLSDVAVITLYVNTFYSGLSPEIEYIWVEAIASSLSISTDRIQNFSIEKLEGPYYGKAVDIHPLEHGKSFTSEEVDILHHRAQADDDWEEQSTHMPTNQSDSILQNLRDTEVPETRVMKRYPKYETKTTMISIKLHKSTEPTSLHHKKDSSAKHHPPSKKYHNESLTYKIKFLLLPARSSKLHEGTVSSVSQKIDSLFQQKKFTWSLNGTIVTVVSMNTTDKHVISDHTFCTKGELQLYTADQLQLIGAVTKSGNTTTFHLFVNSTNSIYGPGKFDLTLLMTGMVGDDANLTDVVDYAFVCVMPKIERSDCTRYEFESKDYELLPNRSILLSDVQYNTSEYEYRDEASGTIDICVLDSDLHPTNMSRSYLVVHGCVRGFEKFILASAYMTAVLGRVSIVALAVVFLTYCLLPQLRNLPGVNTMNLTLSLLIAESIFIIGEQTVGTPWVCSLVSILLHYFFLASFFWMNVMSFDVFRTFANNTCALPHIREKSKHLLKYVMYSWGSPAVIVSICVCLDFTRVIPGVHIGYGRHQSEKSDEGNSSVNGTNNLNRTTTPDNASLGCWIQNPVASLTAFGAPIVLILIVNIYLFVKTILCIRKTAKFTSDNTRRFTMNRHNGRNDVILYVRMSTVMGFTWLFGLASSVISAITTTSSDVICYTEHVIGLLFVIFNCSQGLFIFFAFVTKKRVFFLYKALWMRIKKRIVQRRLNRQRCLSNSGSNSSTSSRATVSTICSKNDGCVSASRITK